MPSDTNLNNTVVLFPNLKALPNWVARVASASHLPHSHMHKLSRYMQWTLFIRSRDTKYLGYPQWVTRGPR